MRKLIIAPDVKKLVPESPPHKENVIIYCEYSIMFNALKYSFLFFSLCLPLSSFHQTTIAKKTTNLFQVEEAQGIFRYRQRDSLSSK